MCIRTVVFKCFRTLSLKANCVRSSQVETRSDAVMATVIQRIYPGLSVEPTRDCIRANATDAELRTMAESADFVGGVAQSTVLTVIDRPETGACLRARGITLS